MFSKLLRACVDVAFPSTSSILLPKAADNVFLFRIALSLFAIHTTSDLMSEIMTQLARHPEVIEPLRKEVIEVLSRDGLKKIALYNLKLMDSVIKECQRIKPVTIGKQCSPKSRQNVMSGSLNITHAPPQCPCSVAQSSR